MNIAEWLEKIGVCMPPLTLKTVLFGWFPIKNNLLINQVLLTFKMCVYYSRNEFNQTICNLLSDFKRRLKYIEKIEYVLAKQKGNFTKYFEKWDKVWLHL